MLLIINIKYYKNDSFDTNYLSENSVNGIYEDNDGLISNSINSIVGYDGCIWIGTQDGLNKINKKNNKIKSYNSNDMLNSLKIKYLYLDSNKYLWIGKSKGTHILNIYTAEIIDISYILSKNNDTIYNNLSQVI